MLAEPSWLDYRYTSQHARSKLSKHDRVGALTLHSSGPDDSVPCGLAASLLGATEISFTHHHPTGIRIPLGAHLGGSAPPSRQRKALLTTLRR